MQLKNVVLLHGLGRTKFSMHYLGIRLSQAGYQVYNFGYRSRSYAIEEQVEKLYDFLKSKLSIEQELNFVTHSLGSLITRSFVERYHNTFDLKRVVMLGPPNQGSVLARTLSKLPGFKMILGPGFNDICTLNIGLATDKIEVGIIAGGRSNSKGILPLFNGDNDGIVKVEETMLSGAKDHIVLPGLHSFLMYQPSVINQITNFLESGSFIRKP